MAFKVRGCNSHCAMVNRSYVYQCLSLIIFKTKVLLLTMVLD